MALAGHYNCSRGFDRRDVPCLAHRVRHADNAADLHEVDNLARDAADVDTDSGDSEPDDDDEDDDAGDDAGSAL